ncbi:4Fe-4S ferredoxin-type domain-containing protein [Paenibacillus sediminis]|uniref:Uncharacterized protein n=1 Tax=Paenibacillus sediminis TaxID=664909 RepID=A0ABS4GZ42_9BACL|nr:hypothetical protein [Paenibacillus sediminis]MBP1935520.1 hypothetical protein [Paenibacillus sediminis]
MVKGKGKKAKKSTGNDGLRTYMRLVTSETCEVCPTPCTRGLLYAENMRQPGAVGNGVPCILTKYRA